MNKVEEIKVVTKYFVSRPVKNIFFSCYMFSDVIYKIRGIKTHYLAFFRNIFCIFVVIRGEGDKFESFGKYSIYER